MKMRNLCAAFVLLIFTGLVSSCSDDDNAPITLSYRVPTDATFDNQYPALFMYMFGNDIYMDIHGGDGNYRVTNYSKDLFRASLTQNTIAFEPISEGLGDVLIEDGSGNYYKLQVCVSYHSLTYRVLGHEVYIKGESLTEEDREDLKQDMLKRIPVDVKGMYILEYTNRDKTVGTVDVYSSGPVQKATFEIDKSGGEKEEYLYRETITINLNEVKYVYDFSVYWRHMQTRVSYAPPCMLVEDVTDIFKEKYPAMEKAFIMQVVKVES